MMLIAGKWIRGKGKRFAVRNPATGARIVEYPLADLTQLTAALGGAQDGLRAWRDASATERSALLLSTGALLEERRQAIAELTTREEGKTRGEALGEWDRVVETFRWHGEQAAGMVEGRFGRELDEDPAQQRFTRLEPVGVCAGFTAWNFPALLPARKIAPALTAGCSIILKAAEECPASAMAVVQALVDAGLPAGVVSLVFGEPDEVSSFLLTQPCVRKCTFTGSVPVGKLLASRAAADLTRCTLELGGHAPVIVTGDVDLDAAIQTITPFKYRNSGQACIAPTRFYVERALYPAFVEAFVARSEKVRVGDGMRADTQMGPLANGRRVQAMRHLAADAQAQGARCALQGEPVAAAHTELDAGGYYWLPSVYCDVPASAQMMRTEPFGPISAIAPFDEIGEALHKANSLGYGLASYVFTGSAERAQYLVQRLEAGGVVVNGTAVMPVDAPFGGVKDSGYGYEGGVEGIDGFLNKKFVSVNPSMFQRHRGARHGSVAAEQPH